DLLLRCRDDLSLGHCGGDLCQVARLGDVAENDAHGRGNRIGAIVLIVEFSHRSASPYPTPTLSFLVGLVSLRVRVGRACESHQITLKSMSRRRFGPKKGMVQSSGV